MAASDPSSTETLTLGADFPQPTHEAWRALVDQILKGADFDKRLVSHTYDGVRIDPLSTRADWTGEGDPRGVPGRAPFTRGARAAGMGQDWDIRARHAHPDPDEANAAILRDLHQGVTSIELVVDAEERPTGRGVHVPHLDALDRALKDVHLDIAPISLDTSHVGTASAALMLALWDRRGHAADAVSGYLNIDPIGRFARNGKLPAPLERMVRWAAAFSGHVAQNRPKIRTLSVDTRGYHLAGAGEAQELAVALATGVAYLRACEAEGLSMDEACRQIAFTFTTDADFFVSIAKLRAARMLWDTVTAACGASEAARPMALHGQTAERMMTAYDPHVNMLRTTVAGFAAAVGGAQSVTVLPFTHALGLPDGFARRMARNTQVILMEESGLARVADPAGGSWSLERLTDGLAEKAWGLFQEIERAGGIGADLLSGGIQRRIAEVREARERNIATRKDPLTGVSEFPMLEERTVTVEAPDLEALGAGAASEIAERRGRGEITDAVRAFSMAAADPSRQAVKAWIEGSATGAVVDDLGRQIWTQAQTCDPLPPARLAELYEILRRKSSACEQKTGARPAVFLVTLGAIASHTARATFARNFFAAGGIEGVEPGPLESAEAAAQDFKDSGCAVAVLCGHADDYGATGAGVVQALRQAGAARILVAGRPGEIADETGIDRHIYTGCDVLEALRDVHDVLGLGEGANS